MPKRTLAYVLFCLFALALCLQVVIDNRAQEDRTYRNTEVFREVLRQIRWKYVEDIEEDELLYGALKGMVRKLDPHSQFLTPEEYREMMVSTEGKFSGLGIEVNMEDNWLTVVTPLLGTPAHRQGVLPGDKILKINGDSTRGMSLGEAVKVLRGPPGSSVTITVVHKGATEPTDITIARATIRIESVRFAQIIASESESESERGPAIGYVRVLSFQSNTALNLRQAMQKLLKQGLQGLVLDLRNNGGGLLDQAEAVSDLFLTEGVIVSTRGRGGRRPDVKTAQLKGTLPSFPLTVLINEGSASAAEIVAAALRDNDRAILVGAKSYGKGSVQTIIHVPIDPARRPGTIAAVKLTTATYYTPAGISIHGKGIEPDIQVKMSAQQVRAVEEQQHAAWVRSNRPSGDAPSSEAAALAQAAQETLSVPPPVKDIQLEQAVEYLKVYLREGRKPARAFVDAHQQKVKQALKLASRKATPDKKQSAKSVKLLEESTSDKQWPEQDKLIQAPTTEAAPLTE